MAPKFYLAKEGQDLTRIDLAELKELIVNGTITGDDLIYAKHLTVWTKTRHAKGFRTLIARIESCSKSSEGEASEILHQSEKIIDATLSVPQLPHTTEVPKPLSDFKPDNQSRRPISYYIAQKSTDNIKNPGSANIQKTKRIQMIAASILFILLGVTTYLLIPSSRLSKANVAGTVKFLGQPIESGKISFESPDATSPGSNGNIVNGQYEMSGDEGPGTGIMIVRFWATRKTGRKLDPKKLGPGLEQSMTDLDEQEMYIPAKHNSASKHTVQIIRGKTNVFDFDLDDVPKKK